MLFLNMCAEYGQLIVSFAVGLVILALLYWFSVRNYDYWTKKGIPQTKTFPLLGSMCDAFKKPLHDLEIERYRELGSIYGHYEGLNPVLSVADLKLLRNILVKDFSYFTDRRNIESGNGVEGLMLPHASGNIWRRLRNIVSPTFTTGKIKRMIHIFNECSNTLNINFKKTSENGKLVDIKKLYGAFVIDVIASAAFSTKIDSHNDPDNEFALHASRFFTIKPIIFLKFILFIGFPALCKRFKIALFPKSSMSFFTTVIHQVIEERKRTGEIQNDFLQLLIDTAKEESNSDQHDKDDMLANYGADDVSQQILKFTTSKNLSNDELVAQCIVFFLAGYHTTAIALAIATYYLAIHQDIQDRLRKEIQNAVKDSDGNLNYESIQEMKYLDNIIAETLRLYPPLFRLDRVANEDYSLGDTGIVLRKGTQVTIPVIAIHRDPNHFPDPERFDPDRFNPEEKAKRDSFAYLPFGAGPRNCIGMRFALMEMKVCLANVVKSFNIKTKPETKIPLEFPRGGGLLAPKEIYLAMEPV